MILVCLILCQLVAAFTLRSWTDAYSLANSTVAKLTLSEKVGIVTGTGISGRCVGNTTPVNRTGVSLPSLCFQDGPAGLRLVRNVTGFPTGINVASTFSRRLMRARGVALAEEFRGKGVHVFLGPAMDIMRNPKAGRGWESFGPDPYLSGEAAFETITGVQSVGVMACAKHFLANNQEHWRYGLSADLDDRTMHEIYFYPFLRGIEADVSSVMCAYNRFNQTSSCHNAGLIGPRGILRSAGFKGFVISDWGATHDSAPDNANNGLDIEMPGDWILIGGGVYGSRLTNAVNSGAVSVQRLNEMVASILAPWYRLGQDSDYPATSFDAQHPDGSGPLNLGINVRSGAHTTLSRDIADASAVLLKNNRTTATNGRSISGLPLAMERIKSIAVIGQDAATPHKNCGTLNECNNGTMSVGWGSGSNSLDYIIPPIDAIASFVGRNATITSSLSNDLTAGPTAAKNKDLAIVFVNADSGELGFYDVVDGNMGDRNDLNTWWKGGSLIKAVAAVCNNTVVIVHSVGPVYMDWNTHPNVTAVLYAGAPGEQTGPSIVRVLWGLTNPSGRLPFSIADDEESYATSIVYNSLGFPTITYDEKLLLDYRYMEANKIVPRYSFGFGLSFTTFSYSGLSISAVGDSKLVSFQISNTGTFDGTEIPQLYLGYPPGAGEPPRVLRGFDDVFLMVGRSATVSMTLTLRDMSFWNSVTQNYVKPVGTFTVYIGAALQDV